MPVEFAFEGDSAPPDLEVWKSVATAVFGQRAARVVVGRREGRWEVLVAELAGPGQFTTLAHPHQDGDYAFELRSALAAAGIDVAWQKTK